MTLEIKSLTEGRLAARGQSNDPPRTREYEQKSKKNRALALATKHSRRKHQKDLKKAYLEVLIH
jgi:hypothetical protein